MTVHLRCGSYLLAPVTIDPSRTNTTASSRFQKLISTTKTPLLAFFHDGSIRDQTTCSLMALTHVAEEREQWSKRNATRRCRKLKGSNVGAGLNRVITPHSHSPRPALIRGVQRGGRNNRQKSQKTKSASRAHPIAPTLTHPVAVPRREVIEAGT